MLESVWEGVSFGGIFVPACSSLTRKHACASEDEALRMVVCLEASCRSQAVSLSPASSLSLAVSLAMLSNLCSMLSLSPCSL